ncbi:hypothetical protein BG011_000366, partial [Mortierella polycephala]
VQTNLQQVDVNKFTFQLDDAESINHIVVFLLGTLPFQPGYAATVHLLWPNKTWQLLGMLSNNKPSVIFRLKTGNTLRSQFGATYSSGNENVMSMDSASKASGGSGATTFVTATLGISIEPTDTVMAQIATLQSSTSAPSSSSGSNIPNSTLVPLSSTANTMSASPDSVAAVAQKILTHLYNHVTSFATAILPPGAVVLVPAGGPGSAMNALIGGEGGAGRGSGAGAESSFLPVKAFNDWYQNIVRKAKSDPMFLTRD